MQNLCNVISQFLIQNCEYLFVCHNAVQNLNLMHMGAAYRYLDKEGSAIQATGGTNWKQFLPPSFQKIVFFPSLWAEEELDNWGQEWVEHLFNTEKIKH